MPRRTVIFLVVTFAVGPAMNLRCLWSCGAVELLTSTGACHPTGTQTTLQGTGQGCGESSANLTLFVKSIDAPSLTFLAMDSRSVGVADLAITSLAPACRPGTSPPGNPTVVPLRI